MMDTASEPDVCVVVISFNDAARLPRAIRSIQRQTLRNLEIVVVDDASTDDTEALVRELAAADPRIRYERLSQNSGGCSAPRNRGVDVAHAPWVMFCDSDDEYERHACKNLLLAAERLDADVVCGTAERVDVASGRAKRWRPEVHDVERVGDGLASFPELLYDTISVNKIYRRSMIADNRIRFPEGLLFEDQLFTLEALAASRRVAVIPEVVYRWYVDRLSDEPSITQRRHEAHNVESRIEINRRVDAFMSGRGLADVQRLKDLKFLRHDLYLYLSSMLEVNDETAHMLIEALIPYVRSVNLEPAWQLRPALRVAIYHLLVNDLEGIRSAMRFEKWASVVEVPVVAEGGREFWGCEHLVSGPAAFGMDARVWLDISDLHISSIPFSQRRYLHRITSLTTTGHMVAVTGTTVDYDSSMGSVQAIELRFLINGERTAASMPLTWTGSDGPIRGWEARGRLVGQLGRRLTAKDRGTIGIALTSGSLENITGARGAEAQVPRARVPYPGRTERLGPDELELSAYDNGAVGWRAVRTSTWRNRLVRLRSGWFGIPGARRLAVVSGLVRRDAVPALVHRMGSIGPRRRLAVFETEAGRAVTGSVLAISQQLRADHPDVAQAWVHRGRPELTPEYAEPVERLSLRHEWLLSRARWWIDDGTSPGTARKRRGTTSVLVGDGAPVRRFGLDDPTVLVSKAAVRDTVRRGARTDLLLVASPFAAGISSRALAVSSDTVAAGIARADPAIRRRADGPESIARLRARLDLPGDRRIVVYAPEPRHADREPVPALIDLEEWSEALGDRAYLLVRAHPQERFAVSTRLRFAVRDISDAGDLSPFLAAADLLVSDYSPIVADAAAISTPIVLFQPDRIRYVNRTHGVYPGEGLAGPETTTMDELIALVDDWIVDPGGWERRYADARNAFADERCGPRDGRSSRRSVAAIMRNGASS